MTSVANSTIDTARSIVFFGTGAVSLATLEGISDKLIIEAVITKPDLTTSSGHRVSPEIKIWAEQHNIPCHQPANKAELSQLCAKTSFQSKVGLVVDYGLIIPQAAMDSFELGILNSHFSLLPRWRGADPITWAVLEGDKTTGVTVMKIDAGMDTGEIITAAELPLAPDETTSSLTDKLIELSNKLLTEYVPKYMSGSCTLTRQDDAQATYSSKITKEQGAMDLHGKSATELEREVRAFLGWPGSYFDTNGVLITVLQASVANESIPPGSLARNGKELFVGCRSGALRLERLRLPSRSAISGQDYINTHPSLLTLDSHPSF